MNNEKWYFVKNYKNLYEISNLGNVKSLKRVVPHSRSNFISIKERILKPKLSRSGYYYVHLSKNGKIEALSIHFLVMVAFKKRILNKKWVNHKNGIKTDNRVENLEWCTPGENQKHAHATVLHKHKDRVLKALLEANCKPVIDTITGEEYPSVKIAAFKSGLHKGTLSERLRGRLKNNTNLKYKNE